ncbi:MAG: ChaN family lipoprotein [Deltaproteobacteria bacterium]|nr:ChaN family lipoprotein [Deltaproteobacteria bacterium]
MKGNRKSINRKSREARYEIVAIQQALFKRNQKLIEASIARPPKYLAEYEAEVLRRTKSFREAISPKELIQRAQTVDIVYIGDYHTLRPAQKTFLHVAEGLVKAGRQAGKGQEPLTIFAMEMVETEKQATLDAYMKGKWSKAKENRFLSEVIGPDHWLVGNWENYKPILEFARQNNILVAGIEGKGGTKLHTRSDSLARRDKHMAETIVELLSKYPFHTIMVLVGELHIAPPHLPKMVRKLAGTRNLKKPKCLILYQNREEIYWKLVKQGKEDTIEVVHIKGDEYCSLNTPPHIVQQSYVNWLEAGETLVDSPDLGDKFREIAEIIAQFLGIDLKGALDQVEVYSAHDLSFFARLKQSKAFTKSELDIIREQVLSSESYTIPNMGMVYLAKLSLNHIAEEASHFIHYVCAKSSREPADLVNSFYARCLEEALGFFGSKVINPKRKCDHQRDFLQDIETFREKGIAAVDGEAYRLARFVIAHKDMEKGKSKKSDPWLKVLYSQDVDMFNRLTHALGYMLGDRLYYGLKRDRISKEEIRNLFHERFDEEEQPLLTYFALCRRLSSIRIPKRL